MAKSGIYGWRNTENGKWYVGQSIDVFTRKRGHLSDLRRKIHSNEHLQNSWELYGENVFEFYILEECNSEMLNIREKAWISYYKSNQRGYGYNLTEGGDGSPNPSKETRIKMSEAAKKRPKKPHTKETKEKISLAKKGKKIKPFSEETKKRMSIGHKGLKHTLESKEKMKKSWIVRKQNLASKQK